MASLQDNYTSLTGRIGRQTFWVSSIIIAVIYLVIALLILPLVGLGMMPNLSAMTTNGDTTAMIAELSASTAKAGWVGLVLYLIFAFPIYAVGLKRRHDRDNNGLDLRIYIGLTFVLLLIQALRLGYGTTDFGNGLVIPTPSAFNTVINVIVGLLGLYLFVVMGFLKGTPGPNSYGPDPLVMQ